MKRKVEPAYASGPSPKKNKLSVLHDVVRLLDEVSELELAHLHALVSSKMHSLQTQKDQGYTVSIKTEKKLNEQGYENHCIPPFMKVETEYNSAFGLTQFRHAFAKQVSDLQVPALSVSDLKQELLVARQNNSRKGHPDYIALRVTLHELHVAKKRENASSIWQLQDTPFIARFLCAQMKWRMERIANRVGTSWCPQNDRIVSAVVSSEAELFESHRQQAVTECRKLARRCGGLEALEYGSDHCSEYFKFCSSSFKFTKEEKDGMERTL